MQPGAIADSHVSARSAPSADVCAFRLGAQLQELEAEAVALRSRQGAFTGCSGRGAAQVEMLTGLQSLLTLKLALQKDMPGDISRNETQRILSSTALGTSQRPYGVSETNVMTL